MLQSNDQSWVPFRPNQGELDAIADDVAGIPEIQQKAVAKNRPLHFPDRVARQDQIAGGKVLFKVSAHLLKGLEGVGLFHPGKEHCGIGRISTGLSTPHIESPDFLDLMAAFQTREGARVDFLPLNYPASPAQISAALLCPSNQS